MKTVYKKQIGDHSVVRFISDAVTDPQKTKEKIAPMITEGMGEEDVKRLYLENRVCCAVGPEAECISDEAAEQIQQKLDAMGKNQLLLANGEYVDNFTGAEYWIKSAGKWQKEKIEEIGVSLPANAVLRENLTGEQREEISAQQEDERIAAMSENDKAAAKQAALDSLADEADRLDRRSKIQQSVFDPITWYNEHKAVVEARYA